MSNTIRNSQYITTFGVGSIIDLPELSLMILSPDIDTTWGNDSELRKILDERLSNVFDVSYFVMPPLNISNKVHLCILGSRFPRTMYCPKCYTIHYVRNLEKKFVAENLGCSPDASNSSYICPSCYGVSNKNKYLLIPSRFIIATENGHIDDFPWDWYCHRKNEFRPNRKIFGKISNSCYDQFKPNSQHLKLYFSHKSAALSDIYVKCKKCNASENLGNIFDQDETFLKSYDDYLKFTNFTLPVPWKGKRFNKVEEVYDFIYELVHIENSDVIDKKKRKYPKTLQRGAGNVYFPVTFRGISLPQNSYNKSKTVPTEFKRFVELSFTNNPIFKDFDSYRDKLEYAISLPKVKLEELFAYHYNEDDIRSYLSILNSFQETKPENKKEKLRLQEFQCFSEYSENSDFWYKSNFPEIKKYLDFSCFIDKVVLLEKLKLLHILKGFTRIRPLSFEDLIFTENDSYLNDYLKNEYFRIRDVRLYDGSHDPLIKGKKTEWLPAVEVKGEGIFIKFHDKIFLEWENEESVKARIEKINKNYKRNFAHFNNIKEDELSISSLSARYVLLHSLSHILINEISQDCGYNTASLSEIIYCNQTSENQMNGILIYTSSTDAEGTLGGLSNLGKPGLFDKIFRKAIEKSRWCSSDPLCISVDNGQGFLGVNLAACHSCCMLPETSCENINKFLDRAMLIGTLDDPNLGFFNYIDFI